MLFIWFGGLKVAGGFAGRECGGWHSAMGTPQAVVPALGAVEVVLGLGLVTGLAMRLVLPVLAAHLGGTFLTFVMLPALMFRHHDPLLLTADGEFVAKNLVLISATIVVFTHAHTSRPDIHRQ